MKKYFFVAIFVIVLISLLLYLNSSGKKQSTALSSTPTTIQKPPTEKPAQEPEKVDITALFEIYTFTTKRIFTASMYHNLSEDVYITADDPSVVHVKKAGTAWSDFFATLPMKLSKDCLVTGTKQTFCSGRDGKLRFFINDQENPDALDEIINDGDVLRVNYGG